MSDLHGLGMVLVWLVPLLLAAAVGYYIRDTKKKDLSAKEILDKRYANGEIDTQGHQERLKELQKMEKES